MILTELESLGEYTHCVCYVVRTSGQVVLLSEVFAIIYVTSSTTESF